MLAFFALYYHIFYAISSWFTIVGFGAYKIVINKGYSARKANLINNISPLPQNNEDFLNLLVSCSSPFNKSLEKNLSDQSCIANTDKPQFLVLGDSHALSFVHSAAINQNLKMAMLYVSAQPPYINYVSYSRFVDKLDDRISSLKLFNSHLNTMLTTYNSISSRLLFVLSHMD